MNGQTRKRFWIALATLSVLALAVCAALLLWPSGSREDDSVDFEALQKRNPEIYAWLRFPEAGIDHPVLQRQGASSDEEDEYYLNRDVDGKPSEAGSLFTQYRYNSTDFSDPVTVIYGHRRSIFGQLQSWCQETRLGEDTTFTIYLPGRRLTYQVFAGIPYDDSHVLYYHDFTSERGYTKFFRDVFAVRDPRANLDWSGAPSFGDRVVILATCQEGDESQRYLTMGVLIEDAELPS